MFKDMDDDLDEAYLQFSQFSEGMVALYHANKAIIDGLQKSCDEVQQENAEVLKDIADLKFQISITDMMTELREKNRNSLEEQKVMLTNSIIPMLKKEFKETQDLIESKRKEYADCLKFYRDKWEEYLAVYLTYDGAAERVAAQNRVKLTQIKVMQKEQEVVEKARQAQQLQDIKAQRLKILQKEVMDEYALTQAAQNQLEELKKEVQERKLRIAAKRQQKQEEQRQLEQERKEQESLSQQQALAAQENASQKESASLLNLKFLKFEVPKLDWNDPLGPPINRLKMPSMPSSPLHSQPSGSLVVTQPQSPPATTCTKRPSQLRLSQAPIQSPVVVPHEITESSFLHGDEPSNIGKTLESSEIICAASSVKHHGKMQNLPSNTLPITPNVREMPVNSPNIRREFVLSTDNIAAKLKETVKPKHMTTKNDTVMEFGSVSTGKNESELTSNQDATLNNQADVPSSPSRRPTEEPKECIVSNVKNKDQNEEIPADVQLRCSSPDIFSSQSINAPELLEDDPPYDFSSEYAESPPPFEAVMSPAPANFDSSPSNSMDEDKDLPDNMAAVPSFGTFDFFSQTKSAFGSEKEKGKSNPFSFMF